MMTLASRLKRVAMAMGGSSEVAYMGFHEEDPVRTGTSLSITIKPEHRNADLIFVHARGPSVFTNDTANFLDECSHAGAYPAKMRVYKANAGIDTHTFSMNANIAAGSIAYAAFNGAGLTCDFVKNNNITQEQHRVKTADMTAQRGLVLSLIIKTYSNSNATDTASPPSNSKLISRSANKPNQWFLTSFAIADGLTISGFFGIGGNTTGRPNSAASMSINIKGS